jgi:hypothetical protein
MSGTEREKEYLELLELKEEKKCLVLAWKYGFDNDRDFEDEKKRRETLILWANNRASARGYKPNSPFISLFIEILECAYRNGQQVSNVLGTKLSGDREWKQREFYINTHCYMDVLRLLINLNQQGKIIEFERINEELSGIELIYAKMPYLALREADEYFARLEKQQKQTEMDNERT